MEVSKDKMMGLSRNKKWVVIEQKSYELEFIQANRRAMQVTVVERAMGRTFRTNTSEEGAKWMGTFLCEASVKEVKPLWYQDDSVSIMGGIQQNEKGAYVRFTCYTKNTGGKGKVLCFPAGVEKDGWAVAGLSIWALFNQDPQSNQRNKQFSAQDKGEEVWPTLNNEVRGQGKSILEGTGRNGKQQRSNEGVIIKQAAVVGPSRVEVVANHGVLNASWWGVAVICTPSVRMEKWEPILEKVCSCFGEADLTMLKSGEALVFLKDKQAAEKLASMNPLSCDGIIVSFRRWTPFFNAIQLERFNPQQHLIHLIGIPLHLKKKPVVEELIQSFCSKMEVVEESMNISQNVAIVRIWDAKWESIPRVLTLEERGYVHKIIVEIVQAEPLTVCIPEKKLECKEVTPEDYEPLIGLGTMPVIRSSGVRNSCHKEPIVSGAWDQFELKQKQRHVAEPEWLTWRPLKGNKDKAGEDKYEERGSDVFALASCSEPVQKCRNSNGNDGVGQAGFFGPLMDLNTEEEFQNYMGAGILRSKGEAQSQQKPRKQTSMGFGPSLNVGKRKMGALGWKNERERNRRMVHEILQGMDLHPLGGPSKLCTEPKTQDPSSYSGTSKSGPDTPLVILKHAAAHRRGPDLNSADGGPLLGVSTQNDTRTVSHVDESSMEASCPPGFEKQSGEDDDSCSRVILKEDLIEVGSQTKTKEELIEWIVKSAKKVALELGMTSNRGNQFIDSVMMEVGLKNCKNKGIVEISEDETERINYESSNAGIRDDPVVDGF
ncbi:hypothetical protein FRX31_029571 [Thalictrum thalictroides]|uniref:DUF4283 domain-containing protein n=1 Tax=Thalictrum thalictroides TaxID=46969 RepID=A0A7J6V8Y0_THATH|nr:hypothetical protein FRX31_029571 [Thalictrum thalictroides]